MNMRVPCSSSGQLTSGTPSVFRNNFPGRLNIARGVTGYAAGDVTCGVTGGMACHVTCDVADDVTCDIDYDAVGDVAGGMTYDVTRDGADDVEDGEECDIEVDVEVV